MKTPRTALVGAFVGGGLLLFAVGLFLIGDRRLLFTSRFELHTSFGKVSGLQAGTRVRVAGLDAGEVLEVRIPPRPSEPFLVRMRLRDDVRPLVRVDSVAAVQTDGIVGNRFIQVGRGTDAARMVEPGDTIRGQDPLELADLIEEGREAFRSIAGEIGDLGGELGNAMRNLATLTTSATGAIDEVTHDLKLITNASVKVVDDSRVILDSARGIVADVRAGKGTVGRLLADDTVYQRWTGIAAEAEQAVAGLRAASDRIRGVLDAVDSPGSPLQRIGETLQAAIVDTREVMSDLAEGTEALKRNFLLRGFFRERGFFDLDTISRDAYAAGALEGRGRTALRIWIDAAGLFDRGRDGREQLTEAGRRRLDAAMADLVRYPRDSPLIVEGYAETALGDVAFLASADRAQAVRDYVLTRFRRRATLTGAMPMADQAPGSPRGDGRWSGVALALFVTHDALAGK